MNERTFSSFRNMSRHSILDSDNFETLYQKVLEKEYDDHLVVDLIQKGDYDYPNSILNHRKVTNDELLRLREEILELKNKACELSRTKSGKISEHRAHQIFDRSLLGNIHDLFPFSPYESSREGIWNYLTWYVLLDVAVWRFKKTDSETALQDRFYFNRQRHVFARWWWREEIVSQSEHRASFNFSETEWEMVTERPWLCRNPEVANSLYRVILAAKNGQYPNLVLGNKLVRQWVGQITKLRSQSIWEIYNEDELYLLFEKDLLGLN